MALVEVDVFFFISVTDYFPNDIFQDAVFWADHSKWISHKFYAESLNWLDGGYAGSCVVSAWRCRPKFNPGELQVFLYDLRHRAHESSLPGNRTDIPSLVDISAMKRFFFNARQWKEFTAKEDHDLTTELQQSLLRNARYARSLHFMAHWDSLSN